VLSEFDEIDLRGKKVALFGLGDQVGFSDTFADALFFVADRVRSAGAELVGAWPVAGYEFRSSWAVEDGRFIGLVLDEHNQPELTEVRLDGWLAAILGAFDLAYAAR
jgi:flavodoxin I